MKRPIFGSIYRCQDTPWAKVRGEIILEYGSYTSSTQYPSSRTFYETDELGAIFSDSINRIPLELWCNESGSIPSFYRFILPDKKEIRFTLASGITPISLSALRDNYNPPEATRTSIIEHAENYTDAAIANVVAGQVQSLSTTGVAAGNLSALRIVNLTTKNYASADDLSSSTVGLCLITTGVNTGQTFTGVIEGIVRDSFWSWNAGTLFLGIDGELVSTPPPTAVFIRAIASVNSASEIYFSPEPFGVLI